MNALEISSLTKVFSAGPGRGQAKTAVDNLTLTIAEGETYALLGPNGAGKSTTVMCVLGLLKYKEGHIRVLGGSMDDRKIRSDVAYLPEDYNLHPFLTGREVLEYGYDLYGLPRLERSLAVDRVISLLRLQDAAGRRTSKYSRGMLQRLGLAQCLLGRPRLVILDEPTSGLDPVGSREFRQIIVDLRSKGTTILINSHLLSEVEQTCTRIGILKNGGLITEGSLSEVLGFGPRYKIRVRGLKPSDFKGAEEVQEKDGILHFCVATQKDVYSAVDLIRARGAEILSIEREEKKLEDFFLEQVGS